MQAPNDVWHEELERRKLAVATVVEEHVSHHGVESDLFPFPSAAAAAEVAEKAQCKATQVERYVVANRARWLGPSFSCDARLYFMLYKPQGVSSMRTKGGNTVYDVLPPGFPPLPHVGRLDKQSEGLLLFTDDGHLAHALIDGSERGDNDEKDCSKVPKVYCVQTNSRATVNEAALASLRLPLDLSNGMRSRAALEVREVSSEDTVYTYLSAQSKREGTWIQITIDEGKKHHIRRLMGRAQLPVQRLLRTSLGPLVLGVLQPGEARVLEQSEVDACYTFTGLSASNIPNSVPLPWEATLV